MIVYCAACNKTHDYAEADAERLLHVLMAVYVDALTTRPDGASDETEENRICFDRVFDWSNDPEQYLEYVDVMTMNAYRERYDQVLAAREKDRVQP